MRGTHVTQKWGKLQNLEEATDQDDVWVVKPRKQQHLHGNVYTEGKM